MGGWSLSLSQCRALGLSKVAENVLILVSYPYCVHQWHHLHTFRVSHLLARSRLSPSSSRSLSSCPAIMTAASAHNVCPARLAETSASLVVIVPWVMHSHCAVWWPEFGEYSPWQASSVTMCGLAHVIGSTTLPANVFDVCATRSFHATFSGVREVILGAEYGSEGGIGIGRGMPGALAQTGATFADHGDLHKLCALRPQPLTPLSPSERSSDSCRSLQVNFHTSLPTSDTSSFAKLTSASTHHV